MTPFDDCFFELDGEEYCMKELALARMLQADILFCNTGYFGEGEMREQTVVLFVNCNDLFAWGCADAEPVREDEIGDLYKAWQSGKYGVDKWCCKRRKQQPQGPMEKLIRAAGEWDAEMEALPANTQDAQVHALMVAAAQKTGGTK